MVKGFDGGSWGLHELPCLAWFALVSQMLDLFGYFEQPWLIIGLDTKRISNVVPNYCVKVKF